MRKSLSLFSVIVAFSAQGLASEQPPRLNVGRLITEEDALAKGWSVLPDGSGLPKGRGTAQQGLKTYVDKCAGCHGDRGEGRADFSALVGGRGSLSTDKPVLTVGSYWPTATTLFDYIWRGMPYGAPGSLTADETYALTAWILSANGIIKESTVMDRKSLIRVKMPNADGFIVEEKAIRESR